MATIAMKSASYTLKALLTSLDAFDEAVPTSELFRLLKRFKPVAADLTPYLRFSRSGYRRNLIHTGPGYQAWLLCWRKGQFSPIHDHTGSACGVRVVRGVATEVRYERRCDGRLLVGPTLTHAVGTVIASVDADIHAMGCLAGAAEELVSLHIYSPALTGMKTYPAADVVRAAPKSAAGRGGANGHTVRAKAQSRSLATVGKASRKRRA